MQSWKTVFNDGIVTMSWYSRARATYHLVQCKDCEVLPPMYDASASAVDIRGHRHQFTNPVSCDRDGNDVMIVTFFTTEPL